MRKIQLGAAVLALGLALTACSSDADTSDTASDAESNETLVVAAYNFSESEIIANLYAGALNAAGSTAEIQTLTNREVVIPAVTENELQVVGEYVGTLTEFLNKDINGPDAPAQASSDLDETMTNLRALAEQRDLEVLEPAPAQDQNAFAVTKEFAEKNNLKTLSDLGEYSKGDPVVLGGPPECPQRPFCQPGLEETYGLEVAEFLSLDAGGPLTKQSLEQGKIEEGQHTRGNQGQWNQDDNKHQMSRRGQFGRDLDPRLTRWGKRFVNREFHILRIGHASVTSPAPDGTCAG
jgi:glycine betaine/choline ABC-type transport system substrate-binding protein